MAEHMTCLAFAQDRDQRRRRGK